MIPHRTPFFLPLIYPSLTWRIPSRENELYLTFDDGPVNGPTDFVLEQLKSFNIKATFFCIGDNVRKHPEVFRKIIADGHSIGNHTFNHVNGWKTPTSIYTENVRRFDEQVNEHSVSSLLFRPPYGKITFRQISALRDYRIIMWDVLSKDYSNNIKPDQCLKNTIAASRPGSVIVFHDSFKAEKNLLYTLPRFINHFKEKNYAFKPLLS